MKPYFAKYLPVEGSKPATKAHGQEHKLFLCSRDIQVGDWLTNINGQEFHVDSELLKTFNKGLLPDDYKIVGEISPEAKWVKEGMEFDESELLARPGGASIRRELSHWRSNPLRNYFGVNCDIFVKCPYCGTFK